MNPIQPDADDRLAMTTRLRSQLLEFLKFRVLASQAAFFEDWIPEGSPTVPLDRTLDSTFDIDAFRLWLTPLWPAAQALTDQDLLRSLEQARQLYLDLPACPRS